MPDVSVIIAAWNAEAFIGRALKSALGQTGVDLEVVVADDASTDGTGETVQAVGDARVRYLRLAQNGGPAAARNAAMAAATGDWLLVLDADDDMTPDRARRLLDAAQATEADIVADNFWIVSETGVKPPRLHIPETLDDAAIGIALSDYILRNRLFHGTPALGYLKPMFRASFLAEHKLAYDPTMRVGEDYALVAQAMALGARYTRLRSADYTYITREGSISHRLNAHDLECMIVFDRAFLTDPAARLNPDERTAAQAHLNSLEDGAAFTAMVEAIKARRPSPFLAALVRRPLALRHFSMPILARLGRSWR